MQAAQAEPYTEQGEQDDLNMKTLLSGLIDDDDVHEQAQEKEYKRKL